MGMVPKGEVFEQSKNLKGDYYKYLLKLLK
jgi:hypothetical protein